MNYLKSFLFISALVALSLYTYYIGDKLTETQLDLNMTMEFAIMQADKISALENKCSDTAKQVALMYSICSETQYESEVTIEEGE